MDRVGQVWAGLALVFVQVWDRFEQAQEQTVADTFSFYTGLGRLKTGSDRLRVDSTQVWDRFGTGLGQVWTGLGRLSYGFHTS